MIVQEKQPFCLFRKVFASVSPLISPAVADSHRPLYKFFTGKM
ncbi:MAG TPA: hypothetical protein VK436_00020 [Methanocella sp.]|nr:hypothetical protein [Methanocella sp.]